MSISVFDLFSIGMGPSSSHTVGPLRASNKFIKELEDKDLINLTNTIIVDLYGSLALTGKGHGTDIAVLLGLEGETPEHINPEAILERIDHIRKTSTLNLFQKKKITFNESNNLLFHMDKQLPYHPNGIRFRAYNNEKELLCKIYYSVGGGFIVDHEQTHTETTIIENEHEIPYPFTNAEELLNHCQKNGFSIQKLMMENEKSWRSEEDVKKGLLNIWNVMNQCIERGCLEEGILPGGLHVKRRAKKTRDELLKEQKNRKTPHNFMEWVSVWAMAVNEENAAGGRVVTAPTNGSAGVIPSIIKYYIEFTENPTEEGIVDFLLVAGAIGILYKVGASISAAEMGCMGEIGVACSMAAGALTAVMGGTIKQVENAAEIGMEHNLGLTCDPIKGLVQIPCIERNTMGAVKAINAMLLAFRGDGTHHVSLDHVIATMRQTGHDMMSIYKETSLGGLAVNFPEC